MEMMMVNVREDLWYRVESYFTDEDGTIVSVVAENGTEYKVSEVKELRSAE